MDPSVLFTCLDTPSLPCAATPPGAVHDFEESRVQAPPEAALRYLVKLSVVPESSARCTAWMARDGSVAPGLIAAIAGSFQFAIDPLKMPASTWGVRIRLSTPVMLYANAIGPVTIGRFRAGLLAHLVLCAVAVCSAFSAESDPAKSTWLARKSAMPLPEPPPP